MENPLVTIIIITWNSRQYISPCLKSIFNQTFKDFSVIIIDNGSTDDTVDYVKKHYPQVAIQKNQKNLGFAKANNQGLKIANSKYVLLCNHDIILENDFLEKIIATIECDEQIASVSGKLLKAEWEQKNLPKVKKTAILDSCGLKITRTHQVKEIGSGEKDRGQYNEIKEVFGLSGALVLYRFSALSQVSPRLRFGEADEAGKYQTEWLDEDFFSYKEDVDLAWRLQLAGFKSICNPRAVAYHFRGISQKDERQTRPQLINQLSYKNHLLTIIKNQTLTNLLIYSPFILTREFAKLIFFLLFERSTLKGLGQFLKQLPRALKKRQFIQKNKKVKSKEIRRWFG